MVRDRLMHLGILWLRVLTGLGAAYHGYGKVLGGRMDKFAQGVSEMGFPAPGLFAWAAALSEFAGGIMLMFGIGARIAALFLFLTMSVAFFIRHRLDPLKVKELSLAYWTISGALLMTGPGKWSLDHLLFGKNHRS